MVLIRKCERPDESLKKGVSLACKLLFQLFPKSEKDQSIFLIIYGL